MSLSDYDFADTNNKKHMLFCKKMLEIETFSGQRTDTSCARAYARAILIRCNNIKKTPHHEGAKSFEVLMCCW